MRREKKNHSHKEKNRFKIKPRRDKAENGLANEIQNTSDGIISFLRHPKRPRARFASPSHGYERPNTKKKTYKIKIKTKKSNNISNHARLTHTVWKVKEPCSKWIYESVAPTSISKLLCYVLFLCWFGFGSSVCIVGSFSDFACVSVERLGRPFNAVSFGIFDGYFFFLFLFCHGNKRTWTRGVYFFFVVLNSYSGVEWYRLNKPSSKPWPEFELA